MPCRVRSGKTISTPSGAKRNSVIRSTETCLLNKSNHSATNAETALERISDAVVTSTSNTSAIGVNAGADTVVVVCHVAKRIVGVIGVLRRCPRASPGGRRLHRRASRSTPGKPHDLWEVLIGPFSVTSDGGLLCSLPSIVRPDSFPRGTVKPVVEPAPHPRSKDPACTMTQLTRAAVAGVPAGSSCWRRQ